MKISYLVASIVCLSWSLSTYADYHSSLYREDWMFKTVQNFKLTDKQEKDIQKISDDAQKDLEKYREKYTEIQTQINEDFKNNTFDNDKKSKYIDKEIKINKELHEIRLKERMDIYQQLTPEQRKMFTDSVDKWIKNHQ
ncbi:MAG TPA: hypothetical protein DCZ80_00135 [Legionellales bacterium]|nr:hypothetical protein [Legionellales bacterium]